MNDMEKHEYLIQLQMIQQQAGAMQERLEIINNQIMEMQAIETSLSDLDKKENGGEMLANLGKGIFVKTEVKDKDLFVNVGKEIIVKKSVSETIDVLKNQITRLDEAKEGVISKVGELEGQMQGLIMQAQADQARDQTSSTDQIKEK